MNFHLCPERGMYSYDRRSKTAAKDKVPVFSEFDMHLSERAVEDMVKDSYEIVEGSLKFQRGVMKDPQGAYVNFTYKLAGKDADNENGGSGSVIVKLENNANSVRVIAFVNIDG